MRIALVHYTSFPVIAGVETVMAAHARLFQAGGHEVSILAESREGDSLGVEMVLAAKLRPVLARQDVVFVHNVMTMPFHLALTAALWRLASELTDVRFVCWIHDLAACNPDYASLDGTPANLLAQAHPRCAYIAVSDLRRRQFIRLIDQPDADCRTIPNAVDPTALLDLPPRIAALVHQHRLLDREIVLLQPARLLRRKNVELTLRVTAALRAAGHSCACLITAPPEIHHASSAAYAVEVRTLHEHLGLGDDAHFLNDGPLLSDEEIHGLYRAADALFFPSRQEGFGLPLLEAAAHRLPIFCSDIEPLNTLLSEGVSTFSLEAPPEEIATLLVRTLAADRAHAVRKETVHRFSWEAIYRNFLSPLLLESKTPLSA